MGDKKINFANIPETDESFWEDAVVVVPKKEKVSIRLDKDILDFFRKERKGYQTKINTVLRSYVDHQAMKQG